MDWLINAVYYVVPFVVVLGILVFVHELGHFAVARMCGVKVDVFPSVLARNCGDGGTGREPTGKSPRFRWAVTVSS